jgi:outer membrane receptor protein involved in Fe transport
MLALLLAATPAVAAEGEPEVLVTGTRIPAAQPDALEPIASVRSGYLDDRGLTNLADALNELPGYRGSVTPAGSQNTFGQGVNFIGLYGLGTQRTLTLVDGRRVVSSNVPSAFVNAAPGTQVDLNAIPAILIDRIDRIAIGGAPVYGTDAIAGTVNVMLKRRMTGLDLRATSGIASRGDGFRWNLAAAGRQDFAGGRGNVAAAVSYDRVTGVLANARDFYRANVAGAPNPCTAVRAGVCSAINLVSALGPPGRTPANDGRVNRAIGFNDSLSDGFPGSVLIRDLRVPGMSRGGVLSNGGGANAWQFGPGGALVPFNKGAIFGAAVPGPLAAGATASGGDGLALNDFVQVTSNLQRLNAALFASFDLTDRVTLYADGLFYHGKADELVQQPSFNGVLFSGVSGPLTFRTDNPFLTDQARAQLAMLGYGATFQLSRANADLADLTGWSDSKLHRIVAGAKGKLALGGRDYSFDLSLNYGRNDFTDHGQGIDQQRFVNAVNVTKVGNRIVCSPTPTVIGLPAGQVPIADPACVPLNLFGAGAPSAEALAYILRDTTSRTRTEQFVINANLGGSPFDLLGNPIGLNLGFEHHTEKAEFQPDAFLQAGLGRSSIIVPTKGSYALNELFGEVLVPLIAPDNGRFIDRLELFGRIRQVWNSTAPAFTVWAAGGRIAPVAGVELRGNFTRSFRAPAIYELYSPRTTANLTVSDLCSPANIGAGSVPSIRRANCTAFLARYPLATPLIAASVGAPGYVGGNPNLRSERADSFTYGLALKPSFVPGLTATIDYLSVRIADPITSQNTAAIVSGCFDNPDFNTADPANGNQFCSLIRRADTGQVVADPQNPGIVTGYVNGKRIEMSGVQASLGYVTELRGLGLPGAFEIGGDLFHVRHRLSDVTGVAPARSDGLVTDPKWQTQLRLRYANKAWGWAAQVNYTGTQLVSLSTRADSPNDSREFDHFKPFATVDLALFATTADGFRMTLSVTNLLDRVGEEYHGVIVPASINDALGRRLAVSVAKKW